MAGSRPLRDAPPDADEAAADGHIVLSLPFTDDVSDDATIAGHPQPSARVRRDPHPSVRIVVDVPHAMSALSCGPAYIHELIKRGDLPGVKLGRLTRIPLDGLEAFVARRLATPDV